MKLKYRQALNLALKEEMRRDDSVILMGEDIGMYNGLFRVTEGLFAEFGPTRVIDTPLSEAGFTGFCVGAAMLGLRPVIEMCFAGLVPLAMEPIINQASTMKARLGGQVSIPMVIRLPSGVAPWGGPVNNENLDSLFYSVPGLKIAMPSTPRDARGMMKSGIRGDDPVLFYEHRDLYNTEGLVPEEEELIPFGQAVVRRPGSEVTVVSISEMVFQCLDAAEELRKTEGIDTEVIDLRTLFPLDIATVIESVRKTGRLVVVHEASMIGGWGGEVVAQVANGALDYLEAAPLRIAAKRVPTPSAETLFREVVPQREDIIKGIQSAMAQ
jgi:pyruvate/2-oxoglutarate/acetoin dehydrogenase E1 component